MKEERPIVVVDTHTTPSGRECLSIQWGSLPVGEDFDRYQALMMRAWHRFVKTVGWPSHYLDAIAKGCELEGFDVRWTKKAVREVKARYALHKKFDQPRSSKTRAGSFAPAGQMKNPATRGEPGNGGDVCVGQRPKRKVGLPERPVKRLRLLKSRDDA